MSSSRRSPKPVPPVCNLIVDDKGDTASAPFPASDAIDIVSADIASNATTLTAVLRVAAYTANDPGTIYGKSYLVSFEGARFQNMYLRALEYPGNLIAPAAVQTATGTIPFDFGATNVDATTGQTQYASSGPATGSINAATGEITMSVKIADLTAAGFGKLVPGQQFKSLNAVTFRRVGNQLFAGDDAATSKRYTAGAASCVKVA